MSKVLDVLAFEFPFVNIIKIDAHENKKFLKDAEISRFPTVLFYKNGIIQERYEEGVLEQAELIKRIGLYQY